MPRTWSVRFRGAIVLPALVVLLVGGAAGCAVDDPAASGSRDSKPTRAERQQKSEKAAIVHRTVHTRQTLAFSSQTRQSAQLKKGVSEVVQAGRPGVRLTTYRVTMRNGVETGRRIVQSIVVRRPVPRITLRGTRVDPPPTRSACDPNYTGACVPVASDVDCGGGSGNGPAYVYGTVRVVGSDIYELDYDGDGYGCD